MCCMDYSVLLSGSGVADAQIKSPASVSYVFALCLSSKYLRNMSIFIKPRSCAVVKSGAATEIMNLL